MMQRYKNNVNREQSKVKNFICSYLSCTVRSIWGTSKSSSQPYAHIAWVSPQNLAILHSCILARYASVVWGKMSNDNIIYILYYH